MSQSALPKLGVISTGALFVTDLIGVIPVSYTHLVPRVNSRL